jgi:hypothetical protein
MTRIMQAPISDWDSLLRTAGWVPRNAPSGIVKAAKADEKDYIPCGAAVLQLPTCLTHGS